MLFDATDLEIHVHAECSADGDETTIATPGALFFESVRSFAGDDIQIETNGSRILISDERSKFTLPLMNADDFPMVQDFAPVASRSIPCAELANHLRRTMFACSDESNIFVLGGVAIHILLQAICFVATSGKHMSLCRHDVKGEGEILGVVPRTAIAIIAKSMPPDGNCLIELSTNSARFNWSGGMIESRLLEGRFPKYQQQADRGEYDCHIEIPATSIIAAMRQASLVSSVESEGIILTIDTDRMLIDKSCPEVGDFHTEIPVQNNGDKYTVGVNGKTLNSFAQVLDPEGTIELYLGDPLLVKIVVDESFSYYIAQMATGDE